jgi:stage III sporulation protein AG
MTDFKGSINKWSHFLRTPGMWKLLLVLAGGVFLMICTSSWFAPQQETPVSAEPTAAEEVVESDLAQAEKELEQRLESVLSSVAGAGDVKVTITMASGAEHYYAQNQSRQDRTIEEKDQSGGNRQTTEVNEEDNLVLVSSVSGGKEEPVLIKSTRPEIAGVLVLSEGARDPGLREKLVHAVVTVLDIPVHKVSVLPKKGR